MIEKIDLKKESKSRFIAYIDVLGFKNIIEGKKYSALNDYFFNVKKVFKHIEDVSPEIEYLLISDSIVLIANDSVISFTRLLEAVQTLQHQLFKSDIWLRGSICYGEVFFDKEDNLVVGKGLVKAYLLESEAIYPRVIIDPSLIKRFAYDKQSFYEMFNPLLTSTNLSHLELIHSFPSINEDDAIFVSYGYKVLYEDIVNRTLGYTKRRLANNLYSGQEQYQKFLWTKNYFIEVLNKIESRWRRLSVKDKSQYDTRRYIDENLGEFYKL